MRRPFRLFLLSIAAAATALVSVAPSHAQDWPSRAVKFIVPFGPGSGADIGARLFAERLSAKWGKPVVVENRTGGDALVAISAFVSANEDHTLLFAPTSTFTVHPYMHEKLPYQAADLNPIAKISETVVAVTASTTANLGSLDDLIKRAKAEPGKLNAVAASGLTDFVFRGFLKANNLDVAMVPYRDITGALSDLAEGRVQVMMAAYAVSQPQIQAGRVRALAVTNGTRAPNAPDVPTAVQAGVPSLAMDGLIGLFGPRSMPEGLRQRIAADIAEVAKDPAIGTRLASTAQIMGVTGPAEFAAAIAAQRAKVDEVARLLGMPRKVP